MKAITIYQPWAGLLACGAKKYETRSWATNYRGEIAIHAGKTLWGSIKNMPVMPDMKWTAMKSALFPIQYFEELPLGCVIATAEIVGCRKIYQNPFDKVIYVENDMEMAIDICGNELLFGDFTPGRYAWEFVNMKLLDEPIPAKGKQRLWDWSDAK